MIYNNFISKEEQEDLILWAMSCKSMLNPNPVSPHRFFNQLKNLPKNKITDNIEKRIIDKFDLHSFKKESFIGDILSVIEDGGAVHNHTDIFSVDVEHYRYNVLVQLPEEGGRNIYNNQILDVEARCLLEYRPDLYNHSCEEVKGKDRINLSFGFVNMRRKAGNLIVNN